MAKPRKVKKISHAGSMDKASAIILHTRLKEFYSHWPDPNHIPTPEELHNLRISCKRLRYSAESLSGFYRDRLALLIDLLKRNQDLLGEIQDCVTQRTAIDADLNRLRKRAPKSGEIAALERMIGEYSRRHALLFDQYCEIWRGLVTREFRDCLKSMVKKQPSRDPRGVEMTAARTLDQTV